jgi:hypothetical protein
VSQALVPEIPKLPDDGPIFYKIKASTIVVFIVIDFVVAVGKLFFFFFGAKTSWVDLANGLLCVFLCLGWAYYLSLLYKDRLRPKTSIPLDDTLPW